MTSLIPAGRVTGGWFSHVAEREERGWVGVGFGFVVEREEVLAAVSTRNAMLQRSRRGVRWGIMER